MKSTVVLSAFFAGTVGVAAAAGCYSGPSLSDSSQAPDAAVSPNLPAGADLPCEVAELLTTSCSQCHGEPLAGDAKNRLLSAADLKAPAPSDPSQTNIQLAIARMKDTKKPMPPGAPLGADQVAILEKWVADGMPAGTCAASGGTDYNTPTVCTSNTYWTRGDHESEDMHPGVACIDCHRRKHGPPLTIAGTVYPTAHEPDDCNGIGGATVVITDATGATFKAPVRASGNFKLTKTITPPYSAEVQVAGKAPRKMATKQTDGDCNGCHTEKGTTTASSATPAPGRIMTP